MRAPETMISKMCKSGSLILAGGRAYATTSSPSEDYIEWGDEKTYLRDIGTIGELEASYLAINKDVIRKEKDSYVGDKALKGLYDSVPRFLLSKFFPFFNSDKEALYEGIRKKLEGLGHDYSTEDIVDYLEATDSPLSQTILEDSKLNGNKTEIILDHVTEGKNIISMGSSVFSLDNGEGDVNVIIDGVTYTPGVFLWQTHSLEAAYRSSVSEYMKGGAEMELELAKKLIEKDERMERVFKINSIFDKMFENDGKLEIGDAGIMKEDGKFYAYVKVPEHILADDVSKDYYQFKECIVGSRTEAHGKSIEFNSTPIVLTPNYPHPFVLYFDKYRKLCMGNYNFEKQDLDEGAALAMLLSDARDILLDGWRADTGNLRGTPGWNGWNGLKLTKEEAESSGVPITNRRAKSKSVDNEDETGSLDDPGYPIDFDY